MPGLRITVVDPDDDYLGLEIQAANGRFAGSARVFARPEQLSEFARAISGFPTAAADRRSFEFGSRDPRAAGGFVKLELRCADGAGHAELGVSMEDDSQFYSSAVAHFSFPIQAAALDFFVRELFNIDGSAGGEATLASAV